MYSSAFIHDKAYSLKYYNHHNDNCISMFINTYCIEFPVHHFILEIGYIHSYTIVIDIKYKHEQFDL